jgi:hypothetical protein
MPALTSELQKLELPEEFKQESYERRVHKIELDRMDLCLALKAGKDGKAGVVDHFIEAVHLHDGVVKRIEEKMDEIDELRKLYNKKHRVFRNWDSSYNTMNTFQEDYSEYLQLLPKMRNYEERIEQIDDPIIRAKAEAERERYLEIETKCAGLKAVNKALFISKQIRETSYQALTAAERELMLLKEEEKRIAFRITDDHTVADERGLFIGDYFANVHVGDVLCNFNGHDVENMDFFDIMKLIVGSKGGQKAEFRRYDYRYDRMTGLWRSLEEMRLLNVFLDDPRLSFLEFVACAGKGDKQKVLQELEKGIDSNCYDHARCTALHVAATNGHTEIVDLMIEYGGFVDSRDRNMMTPLLSVIRRGNTEMTRKLVVAGASKSSTDSQHRGPMFYAAASKSVGIAQLFLSPENVNSQDLIWGWSSVHVAASKGDIKMCKLLTSSNGSIYRLSKKELTPEEVALDARQTEVYEFLKDLRLTAPGQVVFTHPETLASLWIGDFSALQPAWISELGATHIFCIVKEEDYIDPITGRGGMRANRLKAVESQVRRLKEMGEDHLEAVKALKGVEEADEESIFHAHELPHCGWMEKEEKITTSTLRVEVDDDDGGHGSWNNLLPHLMGLSKTISDIMKIPRARLLICDHSGYGTSAAIYCAWQLLIHQVRVEVSVEECTRARPSVAMSMSLRRGLEIMQRTLDDKRLQRMRDKLRDAKILSNAF